MAADRREFGSVDPLKELDALVSQYQSVTIPGLPRFCGGAVGYAGYDVIRYTENLPHVPQDDRHLPDLCFALYDAMVIFDHIRKVVLVVALADTALGDLEESRARAEERLEVLCRQLAYSGGDVELTDIDLTIEPTPEVSSNFTQSQFHDAVQKCREFVKAGDVFQVVISQRLEYQSLAEPLDVYRAAPHGESQPVYVSAEDSRCRFGRQLTRNHGSSGRRRNNNSTLSRHPGSWKDTTGRP